MYLVFFDKFGYLFIENMQVQLDKITPSYRTLTMKRNLNKCVTCYKLIAYFINNLQIPCLFSICTKAVPKLLNLRNTLT